MICFCREQKSAFSLTRFTSFFSSFNWDCRFKLDKRCRYLDIRIEFICYTSRSYGCGFYSELIFVESNAAIGKNEQVEKPQLWPREV